MEFKKVFLSEIVPADYNPRKDLKAGDVEYDRIKKSISEFGYVDPIIINSDNTVIGGHQRLKVLKDLGHTQVDVVVVDLPKTKEKALNIALNKITGEWDDERLTGLLSELKDDGEDISLTGFDEKEFDDMLKELHKDDEVQDAEPQVSRAEELQKEWHTELGQMWQCGEHRVICGDCTDAQVVERLMRGEKADMAFTSPPYNAGKNSGTGGYRGNKKREVKDLYSTGFDNKTPEEYREFLLICLKSIASITTDESPVLWNVAYNANSRDDYGKVVFSDSNPFTVKESIVWDKGLGMNVAASGILSRTAEFVFLMSKGVKYYTNQGPHDTLWNIWRISSRDGDSMHNEHGASFPVDLPSEGIKNFSKIARVIYDPFLGSGTTMIACENLGRKCRGCEIDPGYVAVILQRYKDLTGNEPVLMEG